ncbi:adenylosuccinate lyase [Candidatus Micrarchaeota archaeon]|nr:adenylosuccinate lyase [Candidatus Micrarchaeota archaeon]
MISPFEERYKTEMNDVFQEKNKLDKWMDVEIALAKAHYKLGNISKEDYENIKNAKNKVKVERVNEIEAEIHHDLMALVKAMAEQAGRSGGFVHLGATSYDIEDTATALLFRDAMDIIEKSGKDLLKILKKLALEHKRTVCIGRTHGQHAVPTTYGMKFALYYQELKRNLNRLSESRKRILVGKMSGAVGTKATFGKDADKMGELVMKELGLGQAEVTTQVIQRDRHAEVLSVIVLISCLMEKIAKEIRNLQRTEILEISEPFKKKQVGSSTMPHKRNPHKSERVCSLAKLVRANMAVAYENIALEHERDLTNSANERVIFPQIFIATHYMMKQTEYILSGLEFFPENILANLNRTKGLIMAERLMIALSNKGVSRQEAHELVRLSAQKAFKEKRELKEVVKETEFADKFSAKELEDIFNPETYIGNAVKIVEGAVKD